MSEGLSAKDVLKNRRAESQRANPPATSTKPPVAAAKKAKAGKAKSDQKDVMPAPPKPGKIEVYFLPRGATYYASNDHDEFQPYPKSELASLLVSEGYSYLNKLPTGLTPLETEILRITKGQSVHFAGPLGGYRVGTYKIFSTRVLVTNGPEFITPVRGNCNTLLQYYTDLLKEDRFYFYAWLKVAIEGLQEGTPWPVGQLLALGGPVSAGKSVFQELITPMLGGRVSNPYEYLKGGTGFSEHVYAAEHGHLGDEHADPTAKTRRNLGAAIKKLVAEPIAYIHPKGRTPITLTPFLRLSMSLNDNSQSLSVLPSFDSDVAGKIILLRARPDGLAKVKKRFRKWRRCKEALMGEIPAFLYKLQHWQIPPHLQDDRWGVVSFHDPELVQLVNQMSEEERLLELIDTYVLVGEHAHGFRATAFQVQELIRAGASKIGSFGFFRGIEHCGQMLTALEEKRPDRVKFVNKPRGKKVYDLIPDYEE